MNRFFPLRRTVLLGLLMFTVLMSVVFFVASFRTFQRESLGELGSQLRYAAGTLAGTLEWEFSEGEEGSTPFFISQQVTRPYLRFAAFIGVDDKVAATTDLHLQGLPLGRIPGLDRLQADKVRRTLVGEVYPDPTGESLWAIFPVRVPPKSGEVRAPSPGLVLVQLETGSLRALAVERALQFGLFLLVPYVLLVVAIAVLLKRVLTDRIERLLALARSLVAGGRREDVVFRGNDELGQLAREIFSLIGQLSASRDYHVLLLDRIPNPIWHTDGSGQSEYFNAAWLAFTGRSVKEEQGRGWESGIHVEDRDEVRGLLSAAIAGHAPFEAEFRLHHRDGSYHWVRAYGEPILSPEGDFLGYLGSCFDRQQERQALDRVASSEVRFRGLVEHSSAAVYLIQDGRLVYYNPPLAALLGYAPRDLLGRRVRELVAPEDVEFLEHRVGERLAGRAAGSYELLGQRRDGSQVPLEIFSNRIELEGQPTLIGMAIDVSARKAAQEALAAAREVVEASPVVLFRWAGDPQWEIRYVSDNVRRWSAQLGLTLQPGVHFADHLNPEDRDRVQAEVGAAVSAGAGELRQEYRLVTVDGSLLWAESLCRILRTRAGDLLRLEGLVTDITARKLAELALRESEETFRATFEQAAVGVAHFTLDGRFLKANPCLCEMLGYSMTELEALRAEDVTLPEDLAFSRGIWAGLVQGMQDHRNYEKRYRRKDGSVVWVYVSVAVLRDELGRPSRLTAVIEDVTARKAAEDELRRLNAELEQRVGERTAELEDLNRELETFAYSVSHDLKAPLRGIDAYSHMLLEDHTARLDEQGRDYLQRIRRGVSRMGCLIDDLLAYARLDRRAVRAAALDLPALIADLVAERQGELDEAGVELVLAVPPMALVADRDGLLLVLRNLFDNAIKYSCEAKPPRIAISAEAGDGLCRIEVRDNGIGFDMQFYDRIFEIFQRLTPAEAYSGNGVGLAIVRKAMTRMGGRVWAESRPGEGACFHIELPLQGVPEAGH